jgi:transposase InsO family protein
VNIHQNARLTPLSREAMVRRVVSGELTVQEASEQFLVSRRTVWKWIGRFHEDGVHGLADRTSRPRRCPGQIAVSVTASIEVLRRKRMTGAQIARHLDVSRATVYRVIGRRGLSRMARIDPPLPAERYEHASPGALLHLDIKKLGCIGRVGHRINGDRRTRVPGIGWEFVHVAIDDHSRIAFSRIQTDEKHSSAVEFLNTAVQYYRSLGVRIERILTDNGACYRSRAFRHACDLLGIRHRFTRPYRPRTNGKAERFIQTLIREWAYATAYNNSAERTARLPPWLHHYNWHRPHCSLDGKPPLSRLTIDANNLLRLHI